MNRKTHRFDAEDRGYLTPCHVWALAQMGKGYGCEWDPVRKRMVAAHILAWERARGPVPDGLELDHICRVRLCVNVDHIQAITHAENVRRGVHVKLSPADVAIARQLVSSGVSQEEIGRKFGLSQTGISAHTRGLAAERRRARNARVRALRDEGHTLDEIAEMVGLKQWMVNQITLGRCE